MTAEQVILTPVPNQEVQKKTQVQNWGKEVESKYKNVCGD